MRRSCSTRKASSLAQRARLGLVHVGVEAQEQLTGDDGRRLL